MSQYPNPYAAPGGYPPQQGGYPPQQGGYPPQQGGYPPAGGYGFPDPNQPQGYPGYAPQPGGYPPQQGGYPPQQGGYPPQQGGYPPQQGGYPPQQGGYPPQQGGYPPQQGGYPPQQGGYAPQPQGYPGGAYPGQPAPGAYGGSVAPQVVQCQGTVRPKPGFNPEEDAKILRKAMKGLGTDEKAITDVLAHRSNEQRQAIKGMFKTMFGKDLLSELKSELTSHFEQIVIALMLTPPEYDAKQLREAISGAGTKEGTIIEILCSRSNKQIADIKAAYKLIYSGDLEKDLMSDTSGHFRRLCVSLLTGNRMEGQPVNVDKARQDANELYQAGEKVLGTDESKFNQILCSQSFEQLRVVFQEYRNLAHKGLDQAVKSEMSGDLEKGMLAVVGVVENKHRYFADRLYHSMKGAGTKDDTLIRVIVTRCEIDMVQIKAEFQRTYGKTLESFIEDDASGDYKKMLLELVRG